MKKSIFSIIAIIEILVLVISFSACRPDNNKQQSSSFYSPQYADITFERFDTLSSSLIADSAATSRLIDSFHPALEAIAIAHSDTSSLHDVYRHYITSDFYRIFSADVKRVFPSIDEYSSRIIASLGNLHSIIGDSVAVQSRIYSIVTPYNQSIISVDSVMLIALNHYLGPEYPGYDGFDNYRRQVKFPGKMVYDAVESVVGANFPYEPQPGSNALSRMLYEGAVLGLVMRAVPDSNLAELLGYTPDQLKWALNNEREIWKKLAQTQLLFSTSPIEITKLIAPSPATYNIHPDAPGRLGRFVGYRIVESYLESNPDISPADFLANQIYYSESALRDSKYLP